MAQKKPKTKGLRKKELITAKERLISGFLYLCIFIPVGWIVILGTLMWYRKNNFINSHSSMASILFALSLALLFTVFTVEKPANLGIAPIIHTPTLVFLNTIINFTIIASILIALSGRESFLDLLIAKVKSAKK